MLFHPVIIALLLSSLTSTAMVGASVPFAVRLLRRWDLASGSEAQLLLERRTYLVSTLVQLVLLAQLASLVLFVFNADRMASLFTGAMCAVGTLEADRFGFPALYANIALFFLAAAWLTLDHVDNRGWDYPLIRVKYAALLTLAPVLALASLAELAYFLGLRADVITSCCSTLFSGGGITVAGNSLAALPHGLALVLLCLTLLAVFALGLRFLVGGRGGTAYGAASAAAFPVALAAVVSTLSVYVYELPNHHCPFCLLKAEYGHVGYALYIPLFAATACGIGAGIAQRCADRASLAEAAQRTARCLAGWSLAGFAAFAIVAVCLVARSHLILFGPSAWRPLAEFVVGGGR